MTLNPIRAKLVDQPVCSPGDGQKRLKKNPNPVKWKRSKKSNMLTQTAVLSQKWE